MAYTATPTDLDARPGLVSRMFAAIGNGFIAYAEARSRRAIYEALERMSDEELAARGMTRETIALTVFSDKMYL